VRDGRRVVVEASGDTLTLAPAEGAAPGAGTLETAPTASVNGSDSTRLYATIRHRDGARETHRVVRSEGEIRSAHRPEPDRNRSVRSSN